MNAVIIGGGITGLVTAYKLSEKGFKVRYFREYSEKCLAGEDLEFIENYMAKGDTTIFNPAHIEDLFKGKELLEDTVSLPAGRKAN